jgi:ribosomal protein S18 acetylase RimI-like enzyme
MEKSKISDGTTMAASRSDTPVLAKVLARSFEKDPVYNWFIRNDDKRISALERIFSFVLNQAFIDGEVLTTVNKDACAIWFPPNCGILNLSLLNMLRMMPEMYYWTGSFDRLSRLSKVLSFLSENRPKNVHYYLEYIGVDPGKQRLGLGSALMKYKLDALDSKKISVYLENSNERNLPLYTRYGFKVFKEAHVVDNGPKVWFMVRESNNSDL